MQQEKPSLNSDTSEGRSETYDISSQMVQKSPVSKKEDRQEKGRTFDWLKEILFFLADIALNVAIIVALVVLIRFYVIAPFKVSGPSMCDTLNFIGGECVSGSGEYVVVNKLFYLKWFGYQIKPPQRGDIVIFKPPVKGAQDFFIKRIIALPEEKVRIKNGEVYIANEKYPQFFRLEEDYLSVVNEGNTLAYSRGLSEFEVPEGHYFVLGDNRKASSDSRHCFTQRGCTGDATPYVPFENIEGKAWVILWPFSNIRITEAYDYNE